MTLWFEVARLAVVGNVVFLAALAAVWGRNYRAHDADHTLGLLVFGVFLLGETLLAVYLFSFHAAFGGWVYEAALVAQRGTMALNVLALLALGSLAKVTWERPPRCVRRRPVRSLRLWYDKVFAARPRTRYRDDGPARPPHACARTVSVAPGGPIAPRGLMSHSRVTRPGRCDGGELRSTTASPTDEADPDPEANDDTESPR